MAEVIAETARLRLRDWGEGDSDRFYDALNTPAVMRWLGGVQDRASWNSAKARLDGYARDHGHTLWIVERKADGQLLGFCGLKRVNTAEAGPITGDMEIGWRLRESAWGQGYAKEAATASLDLAFGRFAAPHVVALTTGGNRASRGLMQRLGMRHRPELSFDEARFDPELRPTIVYWLDSADWQAARAAALI